MPKLKTLQSDFSQGELAPVAYGRVDVARYPRAAKRLLNVQVRTLGGAVKRSGTEYLGTCKQALQRARLIPYVIGQDNAYLVEFGAAYLRIWKFNGEQVAVSGVPYEVSSPYTEAEALEVDYAQGEDAMYLFHRNYAPYRLRVFNDTTWTLSAAPFSAMPFAELGDYPAVSITLSSNTVGLGRTATASAAVFLVSDVGRAILMGAGVAIITAVGSTTSATVEIRSIFDSATLTSGMWNLDASPMVALTPSAKDPVGENITLTLSAAGWRAGDVGKHVRVNGGLARITVYTSTTVVMAQIVSELTAAVAAPALAWTLEASVWNERDGYPATGTFHEQRLIAAGTRTKPQTVWGSRTGEPLDFTLGVNDDMGFAFTLAGDDSQVNQVRYLASGRALLAFTFGGEYAIFGGTDKPITPTNVQIRQQSSYGAKAVRPTQAGGEVLFVQRGGRRVRSIDYSFERDGYTATDLTTLAEHITESGVTEMAMQQQPDPVLWMVLANGVLLSLTYSRELDVIAWCRHETPGMIESVAVAPAGDLEQVWFVVRRTVGGAPVRYVERLQPAWEPFGGAPEWGFTLDCARTQDAPTASATWGNLGHLEGETVRCVADGFDMGDFVVSAGSITLPRMASRVLVGMMFSPVVEPLRPEVQLATGTAQADVMSVSEVVMRLHDTLGVTVDGVQAMPGKQFGDDVLDAPPKLFSGDIVLSKLGWRRGDAPLVVSQDSATPFHLLSLIRTLTVNGG